MASLLPSPVAHFITLSILIISFTNTPTTGEDYGFVKRIDRKSMGLAKEKLSHFRFYWHDIVSGRSPTSVRVVQPPPSTSTSSTTGFGIISMIDDPLTAGPKLSSKMVGRAQGFYALASQEEVGLLMVMNFAFIEGKYNGSMFTVLGRNPVLSKVREMAVIGGSGLFRFARGYAQLRTHEFNVTTGDAIVEYNVYLGILLRRIRRWWLVL